MHPIPILRRVLAAVALTGIAVRESFAADDYQLGSESMPQDGVPRGKVTAHLGLQFCDQAGRVNGIISKPQNKWLSNVVIGGPNLDTLFVTCGDKVFKRKTKAKGVLSWKPPILPPKPGL